jgi:hypothetical protein
MPQTSTPVEIDDAHLQRFARFEPQPVADNASFPQPAENQSTYSPVNAEPTSTVPNDVEPILEQEIHITTKQQRKLWTSPWIMLLLVGSGVLLIVLVVGVGLGGFVNIDTHASAPAPPQPNATPTPTAEEANGELQTKVALTTQTQELADFKNQTAKPKPPAKVKPVTKQTPTVTPVIRTAPPQPVPIVAQLREFPPVKRTPTAWEPVRSTPQPVMRSQAAPSAPADPMQQWLAAANVGNYGSVSPTNSTQTAAAQPTNDSTNSNYQPTDYQPSDTTTNDTDSLSGGIGQAPRTMSETNYPSSEAVAPAHQPSGSGYPTVDYSNSVNNLVVGARADGKLETPLAWSGSLDSSTGQNFLVKLKDPLKAGNGSVVVPKGSYLVARVTSATDSGIIQMSAVSVLNQENGQTTEQPLAEGAVLILGKGGKPLQAKARSSDNGGSNIGTVLLSGISGVAGLSNQPSFQSVFSNGGFTSTSTSRDPNYIAGFGQGAAQELLRQVQNRQQQRQSIQSEPIFVLDQGTSVQVFVNQSVSL